MNNSTEIFYQIQRQECFDFAADLLQSIEEIKKACPEYECRTDLKKELSLLMYELQKESVRQGFDEMKRSSNFYGKDSFCTPEEILKV